MNKNSQILILDLILSVIIIIVSFTFIFSYFYSQEGNSDLYTLNLNILNGFTLTKINSLNDNEIRNFFIGGNIKNVENTIANQIAEFYYFNEDILARNLTKIYMSSFDIKKYNIQITLINNTGGEFILLKEMKNIRSFEQAQISSKIEREIMGFINLNEYYGPYKFEVKIWY